MIHIKDKSMCTGCCACSSICPVQCIEMKADDEGFLYPVINLECCIECNLCETTCPTMNLINFKKKPSVFAVQNCNTEIRARSSSGGMFAAIAEYILKQNGVVFGSGYNKNFDVVHKYVENWDEWLKCDLCGSKYVESKIGDSFIKAKEYLELGVLVCFSGTPCQIAGLKAYLTKDYSNLITIDLVCHGVPSPKFFDRFLCYCSMKYKSQIEKINFRDKTFGYNTPSFRLIFKNRKHKEQNFLVKSFVRSYFKGLCSRPSCYICPYKTVGRHSDFTLSDCWSIGKISIGHDDDKGTTLVFIHSDKGMRILDLISNNLNVITVDLDYALKTDAHFMVKNDVQNDRRKNFFIDLDKMDYIKLIKKYSPNSLKNTIANFSRTLLLKAGLVNYISVQKFIKKFK